MKSLHISFLKKSNVKKLIQYNIENWQQNKLKIKTYITRD